MNEVKQYYQATKPGLELRYTHCHEIITPETQIDEEMAGKLLECITYANTMKKDIPSGSSLKGQLSAILASDTAALFAYYNNAGTTTQGQPTTATTKQKVVHVFKDPKSKNAKCAIEVENACIKVFHPHAESHRVSRVKITECLKRHGEMIASHNLQAWEKEITEPDQARFNKKNKKAKSADPSPRQSISKDNIATPPLHSPSEKRGDHSKQEEEVNSHISDQSSTINPASLPYHPSSPICDSKEKSNVEEEEEEDGNSPLYYPSSPAHVSPLGWHVNRNNHSIPEEDETQFDEEIIEPSSKRKEISENSSNVANNKAQNKRQKVDISDSF